jgi:hypothetical protein
MLRFTDTALGDEDRPAVSLAGPVLSAIPLGTRKAKAAAIWSRLIESIRVA